MTSEEFRQWATLIAFQERLRQYLDARESQYSDKACVCDADDLTAAMFPDPPKVERGEPPPFKLDDDLVAEAELREACGELLGIYRQNYGNGGPMCLIPIMDRISSLVEKSQ